LAFIGEKTKFIRKMLVQKAKIWFDSFIKTYVWLIIPICIFGNFKSCENYIENGEHLTSYSISVNGYYRKDGTYVSSYKRRPSGGIKHDAPYKKERFYSSILFLVFTGGNLISFYIFYIRGCSELGEIKNLERKKRKIRKENIITEYLKLLDFDFSELKIKPDNLTSNIKSKCKFCGKKNYKKEFYVYFKAITNIHYVCYKCLNEKLIIGKFQKSSDFELEKNYIENYKFSLEKFTLQLQKINTSEFQLEKYEIERIFIENLNFTENRKEN
jgi:hypothetical protein